MLSSENICLIEKCGHFVVRFFSLHFLEGADKLKKVLLGPYVLQAGVQEEVIKPQNQNELTARWRQQQWKQILIGCRYKTERR